MVKITLHHICWKLEFSCQQREPLLGNGSANTPVARERYCKRHVTGGSRGDRGNLTIEELWDRRFLWGPRQGSLQTRREWALASGRQTQLGDNGQGLQSWRVFVRRSPTSKDVEHGGRGMYDVGSRYKAIIGNGLISNSTVINCSYNW
jgi:hypothetical protein